MRSGINRFLQTSSVLLLACVLGVASGVWAKNTHSTGSEAGERQAWFGDMVQPHVVTGCLPTVPVSSTTLPSTPCVAYVRGANNDLVYVNQAASTIGALTGGNGTYWLAVHRNTSTTVSGWTRQSTTHYLWQMNASQPAVASDILQLAKVTIAGGIITAVESLGHYSPRGQAVVYTSQFASAASPIQAAIDALPKQGGTVYVEPGTHLITSTINIGSGDVGVASAKEGVVLECIGQPGRSKTEASTVLKYTGAEDNPVIAVKGPLVGWGVKNCYIDANSLANVGLYVQSARGGDSSNLVFEGHTYAAIHSTCVPTGGFWNGATDSLRNKWYGMWIWHLPPAQAGSAGIVLNSSNASCNTDFNDFFSTSVLVSGVDGWGVYLGASDHNMFYNLHIFDETETPTRSGVHFAYDNGIFAGWPCSNNLYGVSLGETGMSSSGTPLADNTCSNSIFGLSGGDPANFIPDLPGVTAIYGDKVSQDLMLIAGRGSGNTKTVGDVMVYTHASNPRHLTPSTDNLSDLGRGAGPYGAKRWKNLHLSGGMIGTQRGLTGSVETMALGDHYVQFGNTGGATNFELVSAVTACGRMYFFRNTTSNAVNFNPVLSQTINGGASYTLDDNPSGMIMISDCVNWQIIASFGTH